MDQALIDHMACLEQLEVTALRIKAERDEALKLLREALLYSACGERGPFKSRIREFLERINRGA